MMISAGFWRYPVEMTSMQCKGFDDYWKTARYKNVCLIDTYITVLETCYIDRLKITFFNILHEDLLHVETGEMPYLRKF